MYNNIFMCFEKQTGKVHWHECIGCVPYIILAVQHVTFLQHQVYIELIHYAVLCSV